MIRDAKIDDLGALAKLEEISLLNPWPISQIRYEITENPCAETLVCEEDGEIRGYIDYLSTFDSSTICRLAVFPEFRRKGIASSLLDEMDHRLKKINTSWSTLEVRISNEKAINLYEKRGYEKITIKKSYYDDGEDAIYMVRCY